MKKVSTDNKSKVYFTDVKKDSDKSLIERMATMIDRSKLFESIKTSDRVAIKMHFGERGGHAYIRTPFIGKIVSKVKEYDGIPFVTDSNTLYSHKRHNAIDHLETAKINGFTSETIGAPIIIADGLIGKDQEIFKINGNYFKEIYIASNIFHSDFIIAATHFTGHLMAGFGGSIKNIAMGCASMKGKYSQHSEYLPKVNEKLCTLCGKCIENCGYNAINSGENSIYFISENCIGCGECVTMCRYGAIGPKVPQEIKGLQEKMIEYLMGIINQKKRKILYMNFLIDISPGCDCYLLSNVPISEDIGILLSDDPIAIDKASVDFINNQFGADKFNAVYKSINWKWQLDYGKKMGIGNEEYEMVNLS